jgi:hypothetical protein
MNKRDMQYERGLEEELRKKESKKESKKEETSQDDIEFPGEMMLALRRVTPALLLLLRAASKLREDDHFDVTRKETKIAMARLKMNAEALDLLRCLGPLHPLQLKRAQALTSTHNNELDRAGLRSQRTVDQLRVLKMEEVELARKSAAQRAAHWNKSGGVVGGVNATPPSSSPKESAGPASAGPASAGLDMTHRRASFTATTTFSTAVDAHADMRSRLVLLNNEEREAKRWTTEDLKEDRKARDYAAMTSAEYFLEDDDFDNHREEVGVDSVLWVRAAHEHMAYETLLSEQGGSVDAFERAMHAMEQRRKRAAIGVETKSFTHNTMQVRFGDTYITVNDNDRNPYHSLITTESACTMASGRGNNNKNDDGGGDNDDDDDSENERESSDDVSFSDDENEKNPYFHFQRMEDEAIKKRDGVRQALIEWKEEIALDSEASVDPIARQKRMRELARSMLEEGLI